MNERPVLVGLMDVARCTRGLQVPALVRTERAKPRPRFSVAPGDKTDEAVQGLLSDLGVDVDVRRQAAGKYLVGDETKPLLIRVLRSVRVFEPVRRTGR